MKKNLKWVLKLLIKGGVMANRGKIELRKHKVTFLGHNLQYNKIEPHLNPKQHIESYPRPTNMEEVRQFYGLVQ
jgi:hypothetical protein